MTARPSSPEKRNRRLNRDGAAMLAVLAFILCGTTMLTATMHLMAARLQQTERMGVEVQRHVTWGNSKAVNRQYAFTWALRDNVTRGTSTATLSGWGGADAMAFTNLKAFRSTLRPANTTYTYPFKNIAPPGTTDGGVYFQRTVADSDSSQTEHLYFYNYLKTYPTTLLGDLVVVHRKPSTFTGTYDFTDNLQVNGRVVIWDETANTVNLRAQTCLNMTKTGTNTVRSTASTPVAILPQNWSATTTTTTGYGGTSKPHAITDGSLQMVDNADFTPGSIRHIVESSGSFVQHNGPQVGGTVTGLIGSLLGGLVDLTALLPSTGNPVVITRTYLNNLLLPSAAGSTVKQLLPPLSGTASLLNIGIVIAHHPNLPNVRMTGSLDLVIVLGQLTPFNFVNTDSLAPRVIWVDQDTKPRHVIFIGESNRRLVFVTGRGYGQDTYVGFLGVTELVLGGPLKWRLQWINESTRMTFVPPPLFAHLQCTGGLRTNWCFNCSDSGSTVRMILQKETSPGALETLLPRDGWLEPYMLVR